MVPTTGTQPDDADDDADTDMIFVKTFTLADFGPVIFHPKAHNLLES